jgi:hypothetical protein
VHRILAVLALLLSLLAFQIISLPQQPSPPPPMNRPGMPTEEPGSDIPPQVQKEMQKKANAQRQVDLKRDTERLLKLSAELKDYVDKTNENVLSVEVMKKADEIEKLAHSVKSKMRGSY